MKDSEKLIELLKEHVDLFGLIKLGAKCERLYTSPSQRNAGAWSWEVVNNDHVVIGSQYSMNECVNADYLSVSQCLYTRHYEVFPETNPK